MEGADEYPTLAAVRVSRGQLTLARPRDASVVARATIFGLRRRERTDGVEGGWWGDRESAGSFAG